MAEIAELVRRLQEFEIGFFDVNKTGELVNRLSSDTEVAAEPSRRRTGMQALYQVRKQRQSRALCGQRFTPPIRILCNITCR